MSLSAKEMETRYLGIVQPILRKGSHSFIGLPSPITDCFVAGPENDAVVESLHPDAVATLDLRSPILFSGPSGSGKTTMAATLAALWINDAPQRRITMTSAVEFSRSLTRSIKADDMQRFRQLHRDCDCLFLENVHEFAGKPMAQEEFTATLDHLMGLSRVVVLTALDIAPLLQGVTRALLSRLNYGHSVVLSAPGKESRRALLERIAVHSNLAIDTESLDQLSAHTTEAMTALHLRGVLNRWAHRARLQGEGSNDKLLQGLDRILEPRMAPTPSPHEIAKAVARETRVSVDLLVGPTRKSSVVRARGLAMYLMRQLTTESYDNIGGFFSGRDHTTVMHACKKTEAELPSDTELSRIHDRIRQRFQRMT